MGDGVKSGSYPEGCQSGSLGVRLGSLCFIM